MTGAWRRDPMYFYSGLLNEGSSTSDDVPLRSVIRMSDAKHLERYSHIMKIIISKLLISFLLGSVLISLWEHSVSWSSPTKTSRPRRRELGSGRSSQDGWKMRYLRGSLRFSPRSTVRPRTRSALRREWLMTSRGSCRRNLSCSAQRNQRNDSVPCSSSHS